MNDIDSLTFTVPLATDAHRLAKEFCLQHRDPQKAKQVYLNTLSIYAVNYYCQCLGIETNWAASSSWDPTQRSLMNTADLEIVHRGALECCSIISNQSISQMIPDAQADRIGFVVVQLNEALTEATLLGFSPSTENGVLVVNRLRSLDDLPGFLHQRTTSSTSVNLKDWFQTTFEQGWQTLEALLAANSFALRPAYGFRTHKQSESNLPSQSRPIEGAKLIRLETTVAGSEPKTNTSQTVTLLISLTPQAGDRTRVLLQIHPMSDEPYLPEGLKLQILSEEGDVLQEVKADATNDYIQKQLIANNGESFGVKICLADASWIEKFII